MAKVVECTMFVTDMTVGLDVTNECAHTPPVLPFLFKSSRAPPGM